MTKLIKLIFALLLLAACDKAPEQTSLVETKDQPGATTDTKLVLVTGATGRQGGAAARALLEQGFKVRGLTRNPDSERASALKSLGVDLVKGDFDDQASLDAAMDGVYGVFSVTSFWEHGYEREIQHGKNTVDAAKKAGVAHLVFSSVANSDQETAIPHFDSKYEVEKYIHEAGVPYTILRPVSFMENWEYSREAIIAGKLSSPYSEGTRLQQISVRDIGRFAALAFSNPDDWQGRSLDIAGDEYTVKQVINLFSVATGSPLEFVQVPWDVYEQKAGEEMTIMDKWIDNTGYSANINLVRSYLPEMLTLEDYLQQAGW